MPFNNFTTCRIATLRHSRDCLEETGERDILLRDNFQFWPCPLVKRTVLACWTAFHIDWSVHFVLNARRALVRHVSNIVRIVEDFMKE